MVSGMTHKGNWIEQRQQLNHDALVTKALADHMESPGVGMAQQRCSDLRKETFPLQSLPIIECKLTQKRDTNLDKAISFGRGQFSERNLSVSYQEPSHFRN